MVVDSKSKTRLFNNHFKYEIVVNNPVYTRGASNL